MITGIDPYPPELNQRLIDTIPLLCRGKRDVVSFLKGCGVPDAMLADVARQIDNDRNSINKYQIVRSVLNQLNDLYRQGNDRVLGPLRLITRRVIEFENFSACWPDDQLKAKGLVAEIRGIVDVKDAFTRMGQERDRERAARMAEANAKAEKIRRRREQRSALHQQLARLTSWTDVHARGKALEKILNQVFALDGLLVREDFTINLEEGMVGEQIDGVISLDGHDYMVEMKWWKTALDVIPVSRHLVRVYSRGGIRGLMISASGYTPPAIKDCREALTQRVFVLAELHELMLVLEQDADIREWLRAKAQKATIDRNPYHVIMPADLMASSA
jgi:hypothetical protein